MSRKAKLKFLNKLPVFILILLSLETQIESTSNYSQSKKSTQEILSQTSTNSNYSNSNEEKEDKRLSSLSGTNYTILKIIPKGDKIIYTQGLFMEGPNQIVESGGLYSESSLTRMKYPSLEIIKQSKLDSKYFGEGIAKAGDFIFQLTWQERKVLKYDASTLELLDELPMDPALKEGWGLAAYKDHELVATDGSNKIFFLDDKDLKVKRSVEVFYKGSPMDHLNDLIYDGKFLYANVYFGSFILKLNPENGVIASAYELKSLIQNEIDGNTLTSTRLYSGDVLNGIAYEHSRNVFIITGKKWGNLYEVHFK